MRDPNLNDNFAQLRVSVDSAAMLKVGLRAVRIIRARTLEGKDKDGNPFKSYSTKTFAMPADAATKRARKILEKNGQLHYFMTAAQNLWMVVTGGYLAFKKAVYAQTGWSGTVNLTASGQMLRSLTVLTSNSNEVVIGFSRPEDALKAFWNAEKGREFLGLSDSEIEQDQELRQILINGVRFL